MKLSDHKTTLPPPKILLGGLPGIGKTALATSYGEGMQILAVDNALATCMTLKDQFHPERMKIDFVDCIENSPSTVASSFAKVKSHLINLVNLAQQKKLFFPDGMPLTALCIDGLTFLTKAALDYILYNSNKLGKPMTPSSDPKVMYANNPSMPEWGLMINEVVKVFQLIRALPITVIVTCHYEQNMTPEGAMRYDLALPTKELPRQIPGMVDELWFMQGQVQPAGMPLKRVLKTLSQPSVTCRSNYNLPDNTDCSIGMKAILEKMGVKPTL
jgi:hypothetical protein